MRQRKLRTLPVRAYTLKMYGVTVLMLICLFGVRMAAESPPAQTALAPAMFGVSVVIDPGHGGWDPGMVSDTAQEKDINLQVAMLLAEYCRAAGASVSLTRESDIALSESKRADMDARVKLATDAEADIFISLHCNSFVSDRSQHGAQVFYQRNNAAGQKLAETLQAAISRELANTERTALTHSASYLLQNINAAAVICEMGFLSNQKEEAELLDNAYRTKLAWSLYMGLNEYLSAQMQNADE